MGGTTGDYRTRSADETGARPPCARCGEGMYERHCKIVCPRCGYTRDCTDP